MKINLIKSSILLVSSILLIGCILLISSCSNDVSNEDIIDKKNALEFNNVLYKQSDDGSILREDKVNGSYLILLDSEFSTNQNSNRSNSNIITITNSSTGEYFEVFDIEKKNDHYSFNVLTSNGISINQMKYYGENFYEIFGQDNVELKGNQNVVNACAPCAYVLVVAIVEIAADYFSDSPLEQCRGAMNALNCPSGSSAYMQFSEGWFSTTCNVGCRR